MDNIILKYPIYTVLAAGERISVGDKVVIRNEKAYIAKDENSFVGIALNTVGTGENLAYTEAANIEAYE